MLIAGQFYEQIPDPEEEGTRIQRLAQRHDLDAETLSLASKALLVLDERMQAPIGFWQKKVAHTFADIGRERADLMNRLERIATISDLEGPQ